MTIAHPRSARPSFDLYRFLPANNIFQQDIQAYALDEDQTCGKYAANYFNCNRTLFVPYGAAYTGEQKTVRVVSSSTSTAKFTGATASLPVYLMPKGAPTEKVQLYAKNKENPFSPEEHGGLQSHCEAVPMPETSKLLTGGSELTSEGTDKEAIIIQRQSDGRISMWDFFQLQGKPGEWWAHWGGYVDDLRAWAGVYPNFWGSAATSLWTPGGMITHTDYLKVMLGGDIDHMIGFTMPCTGFEPFAPATRQDIKPTGWNIGIVEQFEAKPNITFNDGSGLPPDRKGGGEARIYRFPVGAKASEFAALKGNIMSEAIFRAMQKYGGYVCDGGPTPPLIKQQWWGVLGSPYSLAAMNGMGKQMMTDLAIGYLPAGLNPPKGAGFQEIEEHCVTNGTNCVTNQPWELLETVAPSQMNLHPVRLA